MVGIVTGGNPSSTGVYYDDIWNNDLYPAGTKNCTKAVKGVNVVWTEAIDTKTSGAVNSLSLDAGQGLSGLPGSILSMTGHPRTLINTTLLPVISIVGTHFHRIHLQEKCIKVRVFSHKYSFLLLQVDPTTCKPMYPYQYLKVNTIFEVARESNMRTAWCDKHLAYDILNGPSGAGIQDLFTPEINSDAPTLGSKSTWTSNNTLTRQYDGFKVS